MLVDRLADVGAGHRTAERSREIGADRVQRLHRLFDVDRGHHEHVIAPHDRRAPAAARHVDLPRDVLRRAPRVGQSRVIGSHSGTAAAELRPVLSRAHAPKPPRRSRTTASRVPPWCPRFSHNGPHAQPPLLFSLAGAAALAADHRRHRASGMSRSPAAAVAYEEVKGWPSLPAGVQMGEAAGVAVDVNGHVMVFHRPGRGFDPAATEPLKDPAVLEIDPRIRPPDSFLGREHVPGAARHHGRSGEQRVPHRRRAAAGLQVLARRHVAVQRRRAARRQVGRDAFQSTDGHCDSRRRLVLRVRRLRQQPRRDLRQPRQMDARMGKERSRQRRVQQSARPDVRDRQHRRGRRRSRELAPAVVRSQRRVQARVDRREGRGHDRTRVQRGHRRRTARSTSASAAPTTTPLTPAC